MISDGGLPPGSIHTEEKLAASLSVSRTPVREAARRLEGLGLLERLPSRGLRVTEFTMREMLELSTTREAIEGMLIAEATMRVAAGDVDLARLERIHHRLERILPIGDGDLSLAVSIEFHDEVKRLSGNRFAAQVHDHLLLAFERYRLLAAKRAHRPGELHAEHGTMMAAMRSGDAAEAERLMRSHIRKARVLYARVLSQQLGAET